MLAKEILEEIKTRTDIAAVIGRTVQLRKNGRNFLGLCPFHSEKTPSFYVRPAQGHFKCFGCQVGGDVFTFLEKQTGKSFFEVVKELAQDAGVELPKSVEQTGKPAISVEHKRQLQVLKTAHYYFYESLRKNTEAEDARHYLLAQRRIPQEVLDRFQVGYLEANEQRFLGYLKSKSVTSQEASSLGNWADRVIFPIKSDRGDIIGFGGRTMGKEGDNRPKYTNSATSEIYEKSSVWYALSDMAAQIKQIGEVVLVEGYFDVMAVARAGLPAIALCGTSMSKQHLQILKRHCARVVFCFDADSAGQAASERLLPQFLQAGFSVRTARLPAKDPDEMVCQGQLSLLSHLLKEAPDAVTLFARECSQGSFKQVADRLSAIKKALGLLAQIPDDLLRMQYVRQTAQLFNEDVPLLTKELALMGVKTSYATSRPVVPKRSPMKPLPQSEKLLLSAFLTHPQLLSQAPLDSWNGLSKELEQFLRLWQQKLVESDSPRLLLEIWREIPVERESPVTAAICDQKAKLTEEEAEQIFKDFGLTQGRLKTSVLRGQLQHELSLADQKGDWARVKQLLDAQSRMIETPKA